MNIVIYSKENCVKCNQAKMLLDIKNIGYETKMFGEDFDRNEAISISGGKLEMPIVTIDGVYIGGFNELKALV